MAIQKICKQCGEGFSVTKKEASRSFCSKVCYLENRKLLGPDYRAANNYERLCKNCGLQFSIRGRNLNTQFCTDACRDVFATTNGRDGQMIALTCEHCGQGFKATPKDVKQGRKFCSKDCYSAHLAEHGRPENFVARVIFHCQTCGAPFERGPGELREYHRKFGKDPMYCSRECSHLGRTSVQTRPCRVCDAEFTTEGHSLNRTETCSDPCRRALQRQNLLAKNNAERPPETREVTRNITKQGYVRLRFPSINGVRGREVLEHRYVMEQHLGRELRPEETVHHKVKPTTNNELSNLELFSSRHGPGQRVDEQLDWAFQLFADYADFVAKRGFELRKIAVEPVERLFDDAVESPL